MGHERVSKFVSAAVDLLSGANTVGALHLSRAAESDSDFPCFDDDGHLVAAVRESEHSRQTLIVLEHIDVLVGNLAPSERLTGARGIGSEILAEYENFVIHDRFAANDCGAGYKVCIAKIGAQGLNCK